ncbi:MAG: nucleoside triphosphate pyrophosphohydrolase [Clostridia bacterium]|jgi:predicted house-cleaning noncanonical NTP pyrophosphatase (MazG superfamily)|nr:nucleoside triphosphate pyrophosphohydrolase [Clostridia bacterium]
MKIYNKLVRDKIPEIINSDNRLAITRTLNDSEYLNELNKKLQEEVKEYLEDNNVEELADIVEVIYGILISKKVSIEDFEIIRKNKVDKRGAFNKKIFLEKVIEDGQ